MILARSVEIGKFSGYLGAIENSSNFPHAITTGSTMSLFQIFWGGTLSFPFLVILFSIGLTAPMNSNAQEIDVWVGTGGKEGIFHVKLNTETGKLSKPVNVAKIAGAGFLAMHPTKSVIYSTGKQGNENGIAAFAIAEDDQRIKQELFKANSQLEDLKARFAPNHPEVKATEDLIKKLTKVAHSNGKPRLDLLNFVSSGDGGAACVGVDKTGSVVMSAQYGGGSTSTYTLNEDGSIKALVDAIEHGPGSNVNPRRQAESHPHWVGTSPDNKFLFVPDLGKDAVVVYQLDSKTGVGKKHGEVSTPQGSGPRHMKFHTSGKYVYVLNELSLTISVFGYESDSAKFSELQVIETLPAELKDKHLNSAAEIRVHPNGKFVYSSNRGHDSISVFSVDQSTGKLTFVEREHIRGATPRNFNLDPSGKWLLAGGQRSNTLTAFEVDQATGKLTYNRQCVNIPAPICILFENES